jgi:hypothetical protein
MEFNFFSFNVQGGGPMTIDQSYLILNLTFERLRLRTCIIKN